VLMEGMRHPLHRAFAVAFRARQGADHGPRAVRLDRVESVISDQLSVTRRFSSGHWSLFTDHSPSSAASTFGGDMGSSVSRLPMARSIALAIAAMGGQMLTSATPLAPYGCPGFGTSITTGSIIGRSEATGMR